MSALYVAEVVVILAAFAAMIPMRRAADRAWALYVLTRPLAANWERFQRSIGEQLMPAMTRMTQAVADMRPALERLGKAIREAQRRAGA